jgi:hypothetical protein
LLTALTIEYWPEKPEIFAIWIFPETAFWPWPTLLKEQCGDRKSPETVWFLIPILLLINCT